MMVYDMCVTCNDLYLPTVVLAIAALGREHDFVAMMLSINLHQQPHFYNDTLKIASSKDFIFISRTINLVYTMRPVVQSVGQGWTTGYIV